MLTEKEVLDFGFTLIDDNPIQQTYEKNGFILTRSKLCPAIFYHNSKSIKKFKILANSYNRFCLVK